MAARGAEPKGKGRHHWDDSSDEEIQPTVRPILDGQGRPVGEGLDPVVLRRVMDRMPPGDAELAEQVAQMAGAGAGGRGRPADYVPARGLRGEDDERDDDDDAGNQPPQAAAAGSDTDASGEQNGGSRRFQGVSSRKGAHRKGARDRSTPPGQDRSGASVLPPPQHQQQAQAVQAQTAYPPTVYLHSAPDIGSFHGKRDDDWEKYKTKMLAHFKATGQSDEMAAEQFSRYMEGPAYQYWDMLSDHTKSKLTLVIRQFDKRYADEVRQEHFQHLFDTCKYKGYEDESMDDFAARLQNLANKGYPDYMDQHGYRVSRKEARRIHVRGKFWDCMTPDVREQMYIFFQTREAPLKDQVSYARILQAAKIQTRKEEQSYETVNNAQGVDPTVPRLLWNQLTEVIERQTHEIGALRNMLNWQKGDVGSGGRRPPPTEQDRQKLEQERQRIMASGTSTEPGLRKPTDVEAAATRPKFDISKVKCHNCGEKGHMKRECPQPPKPRQDRRQDRDRAPQSQGGRDDYRPRPREDSREGRRYDDRRSDSRHERRNDRGDERRDSGRYERSGDQGRRSREWTPTRESRYGRGRGESEDRREKKTPMSAIPVDRVNPKRVAQEVVNLLQQSAEGYPLYTEDLN